MCPRRWCNWPDGATLFHQLDATDQDFLVTHFDPNPPPAPEGDVILDEPVFTHGSRRCHYRQFPGSTPTPSPTSARSATLWCSCRRTDRSTTCSASSPCHRSAGGHRWDQRNHGQLLPGSDRNGQPARRPPVSAQPGTRPRASGSADRPRQDVRVPGQLEAALRGRSPSPDANARPRSASTRPTRCAHTDFWPTTT